MTVDPSRNTSVSPAASEGGAHTGEVGEDAEGSGRRCRLRSPVRAVCCAIERAARTGEVENGRECIVGVCQRRAEKQGCGDEPGHGAGSDAVPGRGPRGGRPADRPWPHHRADSSAELATGGKGRFATCGAPRVDRRVARRVCFCRPVGARTSDSEGGGRRAEWGGQFPVKGVPRSRGTVSTIPTVRARAGPLRSRDVGWGVGVRGAPRQAGTPHSRDLVPQSDVLLDRASLRLTRLPDRRLHASRCRCGRQKASAGACPPRVAFSASLLSRVGRPRLSVCRRSPSSRFLRFVADRSGGMDPFYWLAFGAALCVAAALQWRTRASVVGGGNFDVDFRRFKNNYLVVYALMMGASWDFGTSLEASLGAS